jgi:succinoglycan biosynthesis protein ExoH
LDSNVRNRFDALRFLMIAGIVLLHTPEYVPIAEVGADVFSLIKSFFQNALFRTTVPVLTCISGYLVFRANLDRFPAKLLAKKSRSLLVPFLAFNLPVVAAAWLAGAFGGIHLSYDLTTNDPAVWRDAAFGLLGSPVNYPLNFLRDMMALMLIAPLLGMLIRHAPYLGLALCVAFFLNNLDGPLILRDTMPLAFYLGGLAACRNWNLRALDAYAWPCLIGFLLLCASVVYFRTANTTLLRLVSPLLVWPASALLCGSRFGAWCAAMNKYSFFIFCVHAPILIVTWQLYKRVGAGVPYPLYWIAAPLFAVSLLVCLYKVGMRVAPDALQLLLGGRDRKKTDAPLPEAAGAGVLSASVAPAHVRARVPYRPDNR